MNKLRIRFRYSLRYLLVLMILVGFVCWYSSRANRQRASSNWVQENGGDVVYDHFFDRENSFSRPEGIYILDSPPPGPDWLREIVGIDFLDTVVAVSLWDNADIHDISNLCQLYELERLDFYLENKCDYSQLSNLQDLIVLQMTGAPIKNLQPLKSMTSLRRLGLIDTQVTDLSPLKNLTSLEELTIEGDHVLDLTPLEGLKKLKYLRLTIAKVRNWEVLLGLHNLKSLELPAMPEEQQLQLKTALPECEMSILDE